MITGISPEGKRKGNKNFLNIRWERKVFAKLPQPKDDHSRKKRRISPLSCSKSNKLIISSKTI
jgi:hypothetical protein